MARAYHNHGDTGTRLYRIWKSMKSRCYSHKPIYYKWYGARGITVCEEWLNDYPIFKEWALLNGYDETLELDRIEVNGNYSPANCRWISHREQTLNRRDTLSIIMEGICYNTGTFTNLLELPKPTFDSWYYKGILRQRILSRYGKEVVIEGGRKSY